MQRVTGRFRGYRDFGETEEACLSYQTWNGRWGMIDLDRDSGRLICDFGFGGRRKQKL
jgi:hypothetical protein